MESCKWCRHPVSNLMEISSVVSEVKTWDGRARPTHSAFPFKLEYGSPKCHESRSALWSFPSLSVSLCRSARRMAHPPDPSRTWHLYTKTKVSEGLHIPIEFVGQQLRLIQ
jgi:hypothetical protein